MRKCERCFIEMERLGTVHLMKGNVGTLSLPVFAYQCPKCNKIELVKVE